MDDNALLAEALRRAALKPSRFGHPAVFSCEEALEKCPPMPGARTKQLLLKEKKGERVLLVIVMHDKKVDMKALAKNLGTSELTFADSDTMMRLLHVAPGSVTPLGLLFDEAHRIEVFIDQDAWNIGVFQFHPLINTATMIIQRDDFDKWLAYTGHAYEVTAIPRKD